MVSKIALAAVCAMGCGVASWWTRRRKRRNIANKPQPPAEFVVENGNVCTAIVKYVPKVDSVEEVADDRLELYPASARVTWSEGFFDLVVWLQGKGLRAVGHLVGGATVIFVDGTEMMISRGGTMGGGLSRNLSTGMFILPDSMFQNPETLQELLTNLQVLVGNGTEVARIAAFVDVFLRGCGVVPPPGFSPPWIFRRLSEVLAP